MSVVEEGQLKGAFKGFKDRDTMFEFHVGGIWRQDEYKYLYQYAYMPFARVVDEGGRYMLHVEGIDEPVAVKRVR
jgi:hypothetical protein